MNNNYLWVRAFDDGIIYNDSVARLIKKNEVFKIILATTDKIYLSSDEVNAIAIDYYQLFYYFEVKTNIPSNQSVVGYVQEFYGIM